MGAYKVVTKKGAAGWEGKFADALGEGTDPHCAIHDHLQGVYGKGSAKVGRFPFSPREVAEVEDFSAEELQEANRKGKSNVAVGPDKVSHELLRAIANTEDGERGILEWFNRLLHGVEPIPSEWSRASMVLIPKIQVPTEAKHVRPICIGSSTSKLFARMLLARTQDALRYRGSAQSMGSGRQTADYIFSIARLMHLEAEWRQGLVFLKVDVEKAFDSVSQIKDPQLVPQLKRLQHGKVVSSKIFHLPGFGRVGQGDPRLEHHVPGNDTRELLFKATPSVAEVSR